MQPVDDPLPALSAPPEHVSSWAHAGLTACATRAVRPSDPFGSELRVPHANKQRSATNDKQTMLRRRLGMDPPATVRPGQPHAAGTATAARGAGKSARAREHTTADPGVSQRAPRLTPA